MRSTQQDVLDALSARPEGGWQLVPAARAGLSARLADRVRQAADPAGELRPVLALVVALRQQPGSSAAADALVQLLRETPETYAALASARAGADGRGRRERARLESFEGASKTLKAPIHDSPAPAGTVPARQLMRPHDAAARKAKPR